MAKLTQKIHSNLFGSRCETKPGIKYFHACDYKNLRTTKFSFKNSNGFILNGFYYYYDPIDFNSLILFCHGMGGGHEAYLNEIEFFARYGYTVLSFDYQGTIFSEGDKVGGFLQGLSDVDECLEVIKKENHFNNIYLVGHSWGAFNAMNVIKFHPEVKKVVAMSGFLSLKQIFSDSIPFPLKFLYRGLKKIEEKDHEKYKDIDSLNSLSSFKGKALLLHSVEDDIVDFYNSFQFIKDCNNNKNISFKECTGKYHNVSYKIESVNALRSYLKKLEQLSTDEEKIALADKTDFTKLCDLDFGLMNEIINFLRD